MSERTENVKKHFSEKPYWKYECIYFYTTYVYEVQYLIEKEINYTSFTVIEFQLFNACDALKE